MHLPNRLFVAGVALLGLLVGPLAQPANAADLTWTAGTAPAGLAWVGLVFDGSKFVAVANDYAGSGSMTSADGGTTWQSGGTPPAGAWTGLAAGNDRIVATPYSGTEAMYSTDHGATWQLSNPIAGTARQWVSVAHGNGVFAAVAVNSDDTIWSADGISWTRVTGAGVSGWKSAVYGGGTFVAVGYDDNNTKRSTDGKTWVAGGAPTVVGGDWQWMTYGDGRFVALNTNGSTMFSTDGGVTWQAGGSAPELASWQSITFSGGRFVAISNIDDKTMYSDDGAVTWTAGGLAPTSDGWFSVAAGNGRFVAIAESVSTTMWAVAPVSSTSSSGSATPVVYVPWGQSIGRPESGCPVGTASSWARWPNGGIGGFTCDWSTRFDEASRTWVNSAGL